MQRPCRPAAQRRLEAPHRRGRAEKREVRYVRSDFEDALRTAVSLGGDSDTLAAITGSIAEASYGVPEELRHECRKRLIPELAEILRQWESALYNEKICGKI